MKKLVLLAALLMVTSNAYAADDTAAAKKDNPMLKHCRSMMKDGKMMEGMPKQMTDKCNALMKSDGMMDMDKNANHSDADNPAATDTKNDEMQNHHDAAQ